MLSRSINCFFIAVTVLISVAVSSCKETPPPPPAKNPQVKFVISHSWDADSLSDTNWNNTVSGEKVKVEFLAYRLAKITFHMANGNSFVSNAYAFINAYNPQQSSFNIQMVPGEYTGISFLIGVDSIRNHSGAQDGALDPANGLYWEWNTGYIFSMLEGRYINGTDTGALSYHIGLDKNIVQHKKINILPLSVGTEDRTIYLNMNVAEVFRSPNTINMSVDGAFTHSTDHEELAAKVKANYFDCISYVKSE